MSEEVEKTYLLLMPSTLHQDLKVTASLSPGESMKNLIIEALTEKYGGNRLRGGAGYERKT